MGLSERRAIEEFRVANEDGLKNKVNEAAKTGLEIEIDWNSLGAPTWVHKYNEDIPRIYFEPLVKALNSITSDNLGKEAIKSGLKKVVIKNTDEFYGADGVNFENGVLTINLQFTNAHDIDSKVEYISNELQSKL